MRPDLGLLIRLVLLILSLTHRPEQGITDSAAPNEIITSLKTLMMVPRVPVLARVD